MLTAQPLMACCVARVRKIQSDGAGGWNAAGGLIGGPLESMLGSIVGNYCDNIGCHINDDGAGDESPYVGGILGNIETGEEDITLFTISSNFYNFYNEGDSNSIGRVEGDGFEYDKQGAFIYISIPMTG